MCKRQHWWCSVDSEQDRIDRNVKWFGHVMKREGTIAARMNVVGKRGHHFHNLEEDDQKRRWLETIENDMKVAGVCLGEVQVRDKWMSKTNANPNNWEKAKEKKKKLSSESLFFAGIKVLVEVSNIFLFFLDVQTVNE